MAEPGDVALPTLRSERLVLRPFSDDDAERLVALDLDPAVRRFVEDGEPVTREHAISSIHAWADHSARHPGFGVWAAVDASDAGFVGWFHLFARGMDATRCELGYRLVRAAWGRGLATEGSRRLIEHAFGSTPAAAVIAETMAIHVASRRVMEKCGMTMVAAFRAPWPVRIAGDEFGDVRYQITRGAWRSSSRRSVG